MEEEDKSSDAGSARFLLCHMGCRFLENEIYTSVRGLMLFSGYEKEQEKTGRAVILFFWKEYSGGAAR